MQVNWSSMFDSLTDALRKLGGQEDQHLVDRRGHYRVPCRRTVSVYTAREVLGGHMINLGPRGMRIRIPKAVPPKADIRVVVSGKRATNQRFAASIDLICRTIWSRHSKVHDQYDVGIEYVPAPGVDIAYVDAFFRHELGIDDLETYQRRITRRLNTELDVTCWMPDGTASRGQIRDLSLHGAQFESTVDMAPDAEVRLAIEVQGRSVPLYCISRVVRSRPTNRPGWFEMGVSFVEVTSKDEAELRKILVKAARDEQAE